MAAGHPRPDLGHIFHSPAYVSPICEGCHLELAPERVTSKPRAIRLARQHVNETGHTVGLVITHYQRVHPVGS